MVRNERAASLDGANVLPVDCTYVVPRGRCHITVCPSAFWLWLQKNCALRDTATPLRRPWSPHSDITDDSRGPCDDHVDSTASRVCCS